MNKATKDLCERPQKAQKGIIEVRLAGFFVPDATYHNFGNDKPSFIEVTPTELLLEGKGLLQIFLQLKTTVTEKFLVDYAQVPMEVREESYHVTIVKFKTTAFKKNTARYKVSYLHKSLHKNGSLLIQTCSTRLEEINGIIQYFPDPEKSLVLKAIS